MILTVPVMEHILCAFKAEVVVHGVQASQFCEVCPYPTQVGKEVWSHGQ